MKTQTVKLLALLFTLLVNIHLQAQTFDWAKSMTGVGNNSGKSMTTDSKENLYITGFFSETVNFDPNTKANELTSNGEKDIFIQKLDVNGNLVRVTNIGGIGNDEANAIISDLNGHIYIIGNFSETVDFNPNTGVNNLISNGMDDIFIQKLDTNGNFIWAKSIGGPGSDHCQSITINTNGDIYTTGYFNETVDFDPGTGETNLTSNGGDDIFIQKLDADGNLIWAKSMGGTFPDQSFSITTDIDGNIYTTGYFCKKADLDPGTTINEFTANGSYDTFIQKLDENGDLLWVKSMGGTRTDEGLAITLDTKGNIYTTGYFSDVVDFNPGTGNNELTSNGSYDSFIQKLDENGNFIWAKNIGGLHTDRGYSIVTDDNDNVYTTGYFNDIIDFNPGTGVTELTSNGKQDIYIQKLDDNGNFIWAKSTGGADNDKSYSIITDSDKNVYTTGLFNGQIFIQKLSQTTYSTDTHVACGSFTWIDNITYTASNTTATFTLINVAGTDSIVSLDLTIAPAINKTVTSTTPILMANQLGATYQWLDCDNDNSIISSATNQNFIIPENGNYAVQITVGTCVDTSDCIAILNLSTGSLTNKNNTIIYPNPSNGVFNISIDNSTSIKYKLYSITGKVILSGESLHNNISFDLSNKPKGIYMLETENNNTIERHKIIKQ